MEVLVKHFHTRNNIIDRTTDLIEWYRMYVIDTILEKLESFQERDSGWSLCEMWFLKVNFNMYNPINAGMSTYVDVPETRLEIMLML